MPSLAFSLTPKLPLINMILGQFDGRNGMKIIIRKTKEADYRIIEEMAREAFWNLYVPGCDEHYLAHTLRQHSDYIKEMDFVAEIDNRIVGNIMYTKSYVIDERDNKMETLTFGPLCVLPEYQRQGVGTALINYTLELAIERRAKAVIILGHPHNYCKHGFRNCIDFNVCDNEGKYPFGQLVLEIQKGVFDGCKWNFHTSHAYDIDQKAVEEFDKLFPERKKEYRYSQEEFSMAIRAYLG